MKKKGNFYRAVIKLLGILFLLFVGSRQHAPAFSNLPASLLAPTSPQSLCPSSSHANTPRLFPTCRRPCWRLVPARPYHFVRPRQHALGFSNLPAYLLASTFPQSLCPSSSHAETQKYRTGNLCNTKREENGFTDSLSFFFTKIRSCRNYSAITVPTQALPVHAALPSSVSR